MNQESPLIGTAAPSVTVQSGDVPEKPVIEVPPPPSASGNGDGQWSAEDGPRIDRIALARFGMILVIVAEAMTFAGLISAFLSIKASLHEWPPLDQPRFPIEATAINTAILLASGVTLLYFRRLYGREDTTSRMLSSLLIATALLGAIFVGLQGVEWARLIGFGLTMTSSSYGSIFYVIIGFHAVHVVCAVLCLGVVTWMAVANNFPRRMASLEAVGVFWLFVVLVWPVLYAVVYF
jgi:heme/copper-type cytochrome/quinol oxidase subunit 3